MQRILRDAVSRKRTENSRGKCLEDRGLMIFNLLYQINYACMLDVSRLFVIINLNIGFVYLNQGKNLLNVHWTIRRLIRGPFPFSGEEDQFRIHAAELPRHDRFINLASRGMIVKRYWSEYVTRNTCLAEPREARGRVHRALKLWWRLDLCIRLFAVPFCLLWN